MGSPRWGLEVSEERTGGDEEEERRRGYGAVKGELRYHGNMSERERERGVLREI